MKLILASESPRRKELLGYLGFPFIIKTKSTLEESSHDDPVEFCREIAIRKGSIIADDEIDDCLVISADTIVSLGNKIYGKPTDKADARRILGELSGKTHSVYTAVAFHLKYLKKEYSHSFVERSLVTFNSITDDLMDQYLSTGDSMDKAGAYGIQGPSLTFISKVEGDYANVVGFPLSRFIIEMNNFISQKTGQNKWQNIF